MQITYEVSPTFALFHQCEKFMKFVMGPVGSGKSSSCVMDLFFNAMKQVPDKDGIRRSRYCVIRATYPQLRSSTVKTWQEWFKDKIQITYTNPITGRIRYDLADGTKLDMEIFFVAIEDEVAAEKLRSWEFTGAWVNEAHEIPEYLLEAILPARVNRYPSINSGHGAVCPQIVVDYNAVSTEHWLYKWAEEVKPENCEFFRQPPAVLKDASGRYFVNPDAENLNHLADNYYQNMLAVASTEVIQTDLMNMYGERKAGKPVYKDFEDASHTAVATLTPPQGLPVIIGLDQGLTPAAAFTYQAMDGTLCIFDEISTEDCSLKEFAESYLWPMINTKYPWIKKNFVCVIDPAAAQRSMNDAKAGLEILKEAGLPVKLAKSNSPVERREAVTHFLLLRDKFKLSPDCHMLRRGFISEYKYEERRAISGERFKDKPLKNMYSHVHDALQYAAMEYVGSRKRNKFINQHPKKYTVASTIGGY